MAEEKTITWRERKAARKANEGAVGPFRCVVCGLESLTIGGIAAHYGHLHKDIKSPFVVTKHFIALGTGEPTPPRKKWGTAKKKTRKYTKRRAGGPVAESPIHIIEVALNENIVVRVPLTLGPPVFAERNGQ